MVIKLRIFYIFNIKKDVYEIYKDTPSVLYNFFRELYSFNKDNLDYANAIFKEIATKFNKEKIDLKIYLKMHNKLIYSKKSDAHIINNLYKNEISIMKIKRSYIIINANSNYSEFFNFLPLECFVCDFNNSDYFFICKIKMLV